MKKLLITALFIAGTFGFANAQAKQKVVAHKATSTTTVKATTAKTATTAPVVKMEKKSTVATTHVKADGTADKRFKENKTTTVKPAGPLKKNGTPDMRYKANKKK